MVRGSDRTEFHLNDARTSGYEGKAHIHTNSSLINLLDQYDVSHRPSQPAPTL